MSTDMKFVILFVGECENIPLFSFVMIPADLDINAEWVAWKKRSVVEFEEWLRKKGLRWALSDEIPLFNVKTGIWHDERGM